jgi:hypothetical protein
MSENEQFQQNQTIKWLTVISLTIAFISYFIGEPNSFWNPAIIIFTLITAILWVKLPKVMLFIVYQTIVFTASWYILSEYWLPLFNVEWYWFFEGLRVHALIPINYAVIAYLAVYSIISCFATGKLTETQVGQLSFFGGWMPDWKDTKDQKNHWYGVFTGIPEKMVKIKPENATAQVVKDLPLTIQIEIHEDPNNMKFAAVFDFTFSWKIVDTYLFILNKNEPADLIKLVEKALTSWLNDVTNFYKDISEVKKIIPDIERYVIKNGLDESKERFGVEISKFKLIDIEIPKDQIEKQIENAAKMSAQVASDAREKLDTDALIEQAKIIQKEAEKKSEVLTLKEAIDIVQTQRRLIQNTKITGGKPVVLASSKKP